MNKVIKRGVIIAFVASMVAASMLGYRTFHTISQASVVDDESKEAARQKLSESGVVDDSEGAVKDSDEENSAEENSTEEGKESFEDQTDLENQESEEEPQLVIQNEELLRKMAENLIKAAYKGEYKTILGEYKKGGIPNKFKGKKDDEILREIEHECKYDIVDKEQSIKKTIGMDNHNVKYDLIYEEFDCIDSITFDSTTEEVNREIYERYVIKCEVKGKYRVSNFNITTDTEGKLYNFECKTYKPKASENNDYYEENIEIVEKGKDDMKIQALLTMPKKVIKPPVAILVEGSGYSNADNQYVNTRLFADIAHQLAKEGIATLRYDERYFRDPSLAKNNSDIYTSCIDDVVSIVNNLNTNTKIDRNAIYLIARNKATVLAPKIKQKAPRIKGVIFMGAISRSITELERDEAKNLKDAYDTATEEQKKAFLEYYDVKENEAKNQLDKNLRDANTALRITKNSDEMLLGYTKSYWKSCNELKSKELIKRQSYPMLFLQSDCDLHVYASGDYRAFKTILAGESKAYFKLYSKLGHNFTKLYTKNIMEEPKLLEISVGVEKIVINDIVGFIKMISRGQFWN